MYILLAFPQTLHKKTSSKNVDFDKQEVFAFLVGH